MLRLRQWSLVLCFFSPMFVLAQTPDKLGQSAVSDSPAAGKPASTAASDPEREWLSPGMDPENALGFPFIKHLALDQKTFWTSGKEMRRSGGRTFVPFMSFTGLLIASDSWLSRQIPDKPNQLKRSENISQFATYSLVGGAGASFLLGHITHNDHMGEAGLLSGEAAINSTGVNFLLRQIAGRERPFENNGSGRFFHGGNSFPSEHSVLAWSVASVLAHEYPGPLTKFFAYGLASAVTLTRVTSQQHFASDALVGSALGWYFGRQIYRARHDPSVGGGAWGDLREKVLEGPRKPENMGSPYVPIDSWIYSAFDRLAALGYVRSNYAGIRPWTRMECARLLEEGGDRLQSVADAGNEAPRIYEALTHEFFDESRRLDGAANLGASVDSIYGRVTGISGPLLRDGYHFGQTIINDYGRPYGEGFNSVAGFTAHAVAGPLSLDFQGEYQHSPAVQSDPVNVLEAVAAQDLTQPLSNGTADIGRFRILTGSIALTFRNMQFSFGKQSLWLGPGNGGPFLFSDNAEPIPMLRIDQTSPVQIPGLSRLLGPARSEFFLGQLSGQHWVFSNGTLFGPNVNPQPYIHGSKIGFKPTENLEFGLGYTVLFGGPDLPFTWHNFLGTMTSFNGVAPGSARDPGDRRSTFDFSYRVPGLRDWLTIYADSFVEDETSPLGSTRPSMRMGMYFARIPKAPKLDLRLEGLYTDVPGQKTRGFLYWNGRYRSGYTNDDNLLASWIGRQGRGGQAWANYWFSPRSKLQLAYRHQEADRAFIGGGRLNDFGAQTEFMLRPDLSISGMLQYEQWNFPVLSLAGKSNITASFQMTFYPKWHARKNTA
jgi:membrane-associated phospholipid phosphatase